MFGLSVGFIAYLILGAIITSMAPTYARVGTGAGALNFAINTLVWPVEAYSWATGSATAA